MSNNRKRRRPNKPQGAYPAKPFRGRGPQQPAPHEGWGPYHIGPFSALKDVCFRLIDRGQYGILLLAAVLLLAGWKMPPESIAELAHEVLLGFKEFWILGWLLFFCSLWGFMLFFRSFRSQVRKEEKRIGLEKTGLQEKLSDEHLGTSDTP